MLQTQLPSPNQHMVLNALLIFSLQILQFFWQACRTTFWSFALSQCKTHSPMS